MMRQTAAGADEPHTMGTDAIAVGVVATVENSAASPRGADRIGGPGTAGEEYCRQWLRHLNLTSHPKPKPLSGSLQRVLHIARSLCSKPVSATSRTAVYGPVRKVVWQESAGDRRPYADRWGKPDLALGLRLDKSNWGLEQLETQASGE
jgi:hypothetical protein